MGARGYDSSAWDGYQPDLNAPPPDGLRLGVLRTGASMLPPLPAVARLAGRGHLLIDESGFADGARSLLQAAVLRLATATKPGSVRFALADPAGQGTHLSAFLRLPGHLRVGAGVAASDAEIETLLAMLTRHVIEVTQTRLTNVYDSVEAYNSDTTGSTVPYHVLAMAGLPAALSDQAAEMLARLARNGPRPAVHPGHPGPRGTSAARLRPDHAHRPGHERGHGRPRRSDLG